MSLKRGRFPLTSRFRSNAPPDRPNCEFSGQTRTCVRQSGLTALTAARIAATTDGCGSSGDGRPPGFAVKITDDGVAASRPATPKSMTTPGMPGRLSEVDYTVTKQGTCVRSNIGYVAQPSNRHRVAP
jgi:hypothetical protein